MPTRQLVAKELGALLGVLAHPARLQIVEELGLRECDVNSLAGVLGISHSGVSQHLSLLRAHRLVSEQRKGRHVLYRLQRPEIAVWLVQGLEFLAEPAADTENRRQMMDSVRAFWSGESTHG